MDEKRFYIPVAGKNSLCCIICDVNPDEVRASAAKSFFHWQTLKCRYLVNLMQDFIIGSPITSSDRSFYIITTKDFYQDGALKAMLPLLNLTASGPLEVTSRAYIACIKYTFEFILAPQWNRVTHQLYINGREFLINVNSNPTIRMNVNLIENLNSSNDEILMKLFPLNVLLFPLKLNDLELPQSVIIDFENNPMGIINVTQFKTLRVSVLPSMRKGRLISIYKKIPDTCPFRNWTEIRRHWKNMYGYRLPETDDGVIYYEIYFPIAGSYSGHHFIYPNICVRDELSQLPYKNDPGAITHKFIAELIRSMPKMCSYPLQINEKSLKETFISEKEEITPINLPFVMEDLKNTDRLSLETDDNQELDEFNRQITTPMSPTPSLMGKKRPNPVKNNFNFDNLKKIKKIHELNPLMSNRSSLINQTQQSEMKNYKMLFCNSVKSSPLKIPENSNKKTSKIPMKFIRASLANQENSTRLSQIKK